MFSLSLLSQIYILAVRPFSERGTNLLTFVNEAMVALYLLPCYVLTDYLSIEDPRELREAAGKWLVSVIGVTVLVNLGVMCYTIKVYVSGRYKQL